jgi:hypothetical protein
MPKQPITRVLSLLKRLVAVDAALSTSAGLNVKDFARRLKVSTKTVRRDLKLIGGLWTPPVCCRSWDEEAGWMRPWYVWRYPGVTGLLFSRAAQVRYWDPAHHRRGAPPGANYDPGPPPVA